MQQEDYIQRQIEQLSRVLRKLINTLFGLKKNDHLYNVHDNIILELSNELKLDFFVLINCSADNFIKILLSNNKLNNDHLEQLANILLLLAEHSLNDLDNTKKCKLLYTKSQVIFDYLNKVDLTYSFDRQLKITKIIHEINHLP